MGAIEERFAAGEHTTAELAELFGVARSTIYRALDRARAQTVGCVSDATSPVVNRGTP
jgi:hypothetical protein